MACEKWEKMGESGECGKWENMGKCDKWGKMASVTNGKEWQVWQMGKNGKCDKWRSCSETHLEEIFEALGTERGPLRIHLRLERARVCACDEAGSSAVGHPKALSQPRRRCGEREKSAHATSD